MVSRHAVFIHKAPAKREWRPLVLWHICHEPCQHPAACMDYPYRHRHWHVYQKRLMAFHKTSREIFCKAQHFAEERIEVGHRTHYFRDVRALAPDISTPSHLAERHGRPLSKQCISQSRTNSRVHDFVIIIILRPPFRNHSWLSRCRGMRVERRRES